MTFALAEETIEHVTVALINTAGLVIVAVISYLSGRRNERQIRRKRQATRDETPIHAICSQPDP
jgi:membrane protein DedA with SNARE-associated domain